MAKPQGNINTLSFSGVDIVAGITFRGKDPGSTVFKIFGEMSSLSYSIHRDKIPIRLLGSINPVAFAKGSRSLAGTMVFTVFDRHVMRAAIKDVFGKNRNFYPDELPPFDILCFFANENYRASYLGIWGVTLVDEGQVMSISDIYLENQISYMARDISLMENLEDVEWSSMDELVQQSLNATKIKQPQIKITRTSPEFDIRVITETDVYLEK